MDTRDNEIEILLMEKPAFWVEDGIIQESNLPAEKVGIVNGQSIVPFLCSGQAEYASLSAGCIFLTLSLHQTNHRAVVFCIGGRHLFILNSDQTEAEIRAFSLAASQIRLPMMAMTIYTDRLSQTVTDPAAAAQIAALKKGLFQLQRITNNMADAGSYQISQSDNREYCDAAVFFGDMLGKASSYLALTNTSLVYENLEEPLYCLLEPEKTRRAVLNIISNAVKHSPSESVIHAKLCLNGNLLQFSVENELSSSARKNLLDNFERYTREPSVYDSDTGIGLGMSLIVSAACSQGGAVMINTTERGLNTTVSIPIESNNRLLFRSPSVPMDFAPGRDPILIELSDVLPDKAFEK